MNRLNGKRALITGGTTGIGLETVRRRIEKAARLIGSKLLIEDGMSAI
jgi:NAD(P)-dependent dehydrogenase (short-subunit alcohol dehydrogenase family)